MQQPRLAPWIATRVLASSLFLLPLTTAPFAQTTTPPPEPRRVETRVERDYTGLWGLLGLLGLAGLAGRRRPDVVEVYETPAQPHPGTQARR